MERGSLGAKLLKYDTGATALRVSVWGGMTLYTQDAPQACPPPTRAMRTAPAALAVSASELTDRLGDETSHLVYVQNIALQILRRSRRCWRPMPRPAAGPSTP